MRTPFPTGLFVAIEGIDGAGKTTQAALLAQYFGENGILCAFSKEPTSRRYGRELRESARAGRLTIERELELFILDRKDHIEASIRPTLLDGGAVVLDRYFYSTMAYQGSRGCDIEEIRRAHDFAPIPDAVVILDVEPRVGIARIENRGDTPNEFENPEALKEARRIFNEIGGDNVEIIDGSRSIREVKEDVFRFVARAATEKIAKECGTTPEALNRVLELFGGDPIGGETTLPKNRRKARR